MHAKQANQGDKLLDNVVLVTTENLEYVMGIMEAFLEGFHYDIIIARHIQPVVNRDKAEIVKNVTLASHKRIFTLREYPDHIQVILNYSYSASDKFRRDGYLMFPNPLTIHHTNELALRSDPLEYSFSVSFLENQVVIYREEQGIPYTIHLIRAE